MGRMHMEQEKGVVHLQLVSSPTMARKMAEVRKGEKRFGLRDDDVRKLDHPLLLLWLLWLCCPCLEQRQRQRKRE